MVRFHSVPLFINKMSDVYYIIGGVAYGILQFIISWVAGELDVDDTDKESLISDIVYGQMRLIVASMEIEELNSNRDKFLTQARDNINTELNKLGLYLININISDIRDAANYIENLGQKETTKARAQAERAGVAKANTAGSFMAKTAENLNPAFELLKSIPFKKTFKEMFVEDNPTEDNFEAVK